MWWKQIGNTVHIKLKNFDMIYMQTDATVFSESKNSNLFLYSHTPDMEIPLSCVSISVFTNTKVML
jgi:hypothetical protein